MVDAIHFTNFIFIFPLDNIKKYFDLAETNRHENERRSLSKDKNNTIGLVFLELVATIKNHIKTTQNVLSQFLSQKSNLN